MSGQGRFTERNAGSWFERFAAAWREQACAAPLLRRGRCGCGDPIDRAVELDEVRQFAVDVDRLPLFTEGPAISGTVRRLALLVRSANALGPSISA
jgi:hypothetical protein